HDERARRDPVPADAGECGVLGLGLSRRIVKLFRAMREDTDGLPALGASGRSLGVRPGNMLSSDVAAMNPNDLVVPGDGGMSVTPDDPATLPFQRRPKSLGGKGRDPVWYLEEGDLAPDLNFNQDSPTHGTIEVVRPMTLQELQA